MVNRHSVEMGSRISLPCEVKAGFFPDEVMVRIPVAVGEIKKAIVGYVDKNSVVEKNGQKFILTLVIDRPDRKDARIFFPGELISGPNPVTVPLIWLNQYM